MRATLLLLLWTTAAALSPLRHAPFRKAELAPLRARASPVTMMFDEEGEEEDVELPTPYEDWNLAWNRYSLEYLAQAYEVSYEYVEEASDRNPLAASLVGALVACAFMAVVLHAYILHEGGIVIAPGTENAPFELHSFQELKQMSTPHLMKLQIPEPRLGVMLERALQTGQLAGWRSLLVSNTFTLVLDGAL